MKFNQILLCFLLTLFCHKVEASRAEVLSSLPVMEDLRINSHSVLVGFKSIDRDVAMENQRKIGVPAAIVTGHALKSNNKVIEEQAQVRRARARETTTRLTPHEESVLKGLLGREVKLDTFSPALVRSCGFGDTVTDSGLAKKYQNLGHEILYSSIVNIALLERLALKLFKTLLKDENEDTTTWHRLEDAEGAIINAGNGNIRYSVAQNSEPLEILNSDGSHKCKISDRKVRFYFFNNDWDNPDTSSTESANLVLAQVNINVDGGLSYTTNIKGNFLQDVSDEDRKEYASKAYWVAARQYHAAVRNSMPREDETDEILKSIVGANLVDMAASAAKMYRFAAALENNEAIATRHLTFSKGLLKIAEESLPAVQAYHEHVLAAHDRILEFATGPEESDAQFVEDFRFVVGKLPQFELDKGEYNLEIDPKIDQYPSLKAWNTILEAKKKREILEQREYFDLLRGALNIDPTHLILQVEMPEDYKPHSDTSLMMSAGIEAEKGRRDLPLYLQRHQDYYNYDKLMAMIASERKRNEEIRVAISER